MLVTTSPARMAAGSTRAYALHRHRGRRRLPGLHRTALGGLTLSLLFAGGVEAAVALDLSRISQPVNRNQFWVNFGGLSQHFESAERFNQNNFGFGIEYQLSSSKYLVLGEYYNSVRGTTRYLGGAWMPLVYQQFKLGMIAGAADGYPKMRNGGFFPVALPALAFETRYLGANLVLMPSVADKVSGCVALQLKYRFQ